MNDQSEKEFQIKLLAEKIANRIHYYCIYKSNKKYIDCLLDELEKYKYNPKLFYYLRIKIYDLIQYHLEAEKVFDAFVEWNKGL
jgi:hypothetical protein